MPAKRKPLTLATEGQKYVVRFKHPLSKKITRWVLGERPNEREAQARVDRLNLVFMNPAQWVAPVGFDEEMLQLWNDGKQGVRVTPRGVEVDGKTVPATDANVAGLVAVIQKQADEISLLKQETHKQRKQIEALMGRKMRKGNRPTLAQAVNDWKKQYQGRDSEHTKIVGYDLERFVKHFNGDAG